MVDEGFSIAPATAVPASGLDLAKLANGRVVEARVASLTDGIAIVSSRHGALQVDLAAFGRRLPAVGDTVRLQVQAVDGGGRPTVTVVDEAAAAPPVRVEDVVAVLARELRGAAAAQTGLAPLYSALAGLARAPTDAVPQPVRSLVAQIMGNRLGDGGPPDAAAVRKAFGGSGLFLETRLAAAPGARAGAGEDLKAALFSLRAALETWVGSGVSTATTGAARPNPAAAGAVPVATTPTDGVAVTSSRGAGSGDPAGTVRPDAAAMRSAGAAYAGLASRAMGRGAGLPGEAMGAPLGGGRAPVAPLGAAPQANAPVPPTAGMVAGMAAGAEATPPSPVGAATPTSAAVPAEPLAPAAPTPSAATTGRDTGGQPSGPAPGAQGAPPTTRAPSTATTAGVVATLGGGALPGGAGTRVDPLVAPAATPAIGLEPGLVPTAPVGGPGIQPSVGSGVPAAAVGAEPAGGDPAIGDPPTGTAPMPGIVSTPGPVAVAGGAAGRDDGIAILLAAVVKGLEAVGSLTASRPSEMGEAAAALAAIGPERDLKPPPPRRGQAPRGQAALAVDAVGADGVEGLARRALERTEGALARIVLEQFAALDRRNDDGAPSGEARATREWTVEIPLATPAGTGVVQMTVERDGGRGRDAASAARIGWRVRFSMDVEPLGPIHAQIGLSGEKLAIGLWAERPDAAARLGGDVGRLQGALEAAAIPVESIHLATGRPASGGAVPTAGRFVDVKL